MFATMNISIPIQHNVVGLPIVFVSLPRYYHRFSMALPPFTIS